MSFFVDGNVNDLIELNRIIFEKGINININNYKNIERIFKSH